MNRSLYTLALLLAATSAQAGGNKLSCTLVQSCSSKGKCEALAQPVTIGFCDRGSSIDVAAKGGKVTRLNRLMNEDAYKKRPYKVLRGKRLDVGQWGDPDMAAGEPNLITFIMHEDAPNAFLFRGDPLTQRGLSYLQGRCSQIEVNQCRANK